MVGMCACASVYYYFRSGSGRRVYPRSANSIRNIASSKELKNKIIDFSIFEPNFTLKPFHSFINM